MRLSFEIERNPGPMAWFVAEVGFESGPVTVEGYWGLHLGWWALKSFRSWLWDYENDPGDKWRLFRLRLLGFEIVWEKRR